MKKICLLRREGGGGGGGLKAIAEMSAKNVGLFRTSPI